MRLNNKQLLKLVTPSFQSLGFTFFKGKRGYFDLFIKKSYDLYLSVCMNRDRFYDDRFTADMYLSPTTRFASWWGDIPKRCYTRPGYYLTDEELSKFKEDGIIIKDVWWNSTPESVRDFIYAFNVAEERMLSDTKLIESIKESKDMGKLCYQYKEVLRNIIIDVGAKEDKLIVPKIGFDVIPNIWYEEAAKVLLNINEAVNQWNINRIAEDAYRQYVLTKQDG